MEKTINESFGKAYKCCSRKAIQATYAEGIPLKSYPFKVFVLEHPNTENVPFQVVFSAPKRNFKRAHDRNRIKRLLRETFRKKKLKFEDYLNKNEKQIVIFVIYTLRHELPFEELMKQTEKLFHTIEKELAKTK